MVEKTQQQCPRVANCTKQRTVEQVPLRSIKFKPIPWLRPRWNVFFLFFFFFALFVIFHRTSSSLFSNLVSLRINSCAKIKIYTPLFPVTTFLSPVLELINRLILINARNSIGGELGKKIKNQCRSNIFRLRMRWTNKSIDTAIRIDPNRFPRFYIFHFWIPYSSYFRLPRFSPSLPILSSSLSTLVGPIEYLFWPSILHHSL